MQELSTSIGQTAKMPCTAMHAWTIASSTTGATYRIYATQPEGMPPESGWPAIFLLDGEGLFGTVSEAIARLARRTDATGVTKAVAVAICADPVAGVDVRRRDFGTPSSDPHGAGPSSTTELQGEEFLQFLHTALVPALVEAMQLDGRKLSLYGHSLAGFSALNSFLSSASPFARFAAISPSIWWDREGLYARLDHADTGNRRIFLAAGEWEEALPPWQARTEQAESILARRQARRMIRNAREISERIVASSGPDTATFAFFEDEDHASIVSRSIAPALRFISME